MGAEILDFPSVNLDEGDKPESLVILLGDGFGGPSAENRVVTPAPRDFWDPKKRGEEMVLHHQLPRPTRKKIQKVVDFPLSEKD